MRNSRERRTLRVKRETLRALTPQALGRVAGGSLGIDPDGSMSFLCWDNDPQSYSTGSRYC
ncbi:MAG TPA: hypothetical protein VFF36_00780 [Planctomycetota bacterium]|nr:hypothetical protein [Planctomycetota bacterium]